jgi:thioredoxin
MDIATCHGERSAAGGRNPKCLLEKQDVAALPCSEVIPFPVTAAIVLFLLTIVSPANAGYSGGTGEPNDPYQIATAADLIALGNEPNDYDRHFLLTADIDLDPNLPGRKVFDKAVIAPDKVPPSPSGFFSGPGFTGVFDGGGHVVRHLHIEGGQYLGLFGQLGSPAQVFNLGLEEVEVRGTGHDIGGLTGESFGTISAAHSMGTFCGTNRVGGLVGTNWFFRSITASYSAGTITGDEAGVLVGRNCGTLTTSYSAGTVTGREDNGGLVGSNWGSIVSCQSTGTVTGRLVTGGLACWNGGSITASYSTTTVHGDILVGGLAGYNEGRIMTSYSAGVVTGRDRVGGFVSRNSGSITACFWDVQTSGWATSAGGLGLMTAEMQTAKTFLDAGWDFVDETANGTEDIWWIEERQDYPRLWWELPEPVRLPVIELDEASFEAGIAEGVVLVDFYATWCEACARQAPILEEVADRLQGRAQVAKLDIDQARPIVQRYGVAAVPTLILFQDGVEVTRFVGVTSTDVLVAAILSVVNAPAPPGN